MMLSWKKKFVLLIKIFYIKNELFSLEDVDF